jgi:hypothetical protein
MKKPVETLKTVSIEEVLEVGGADRFAKTPRGVDAERVEPSGRLRLSKAKTNALLEQLR